MSLNFKTNIQIKSIIGKDLINNDNIAILELVKNSFDAASKRVDVSFINLKINDDHQTNLYTANTSRIIIQDNGIGMDKSDIENKWLNIAYSEKKINSRQHNRLMAGAKGVGRFSCDRLGEYLNLYTKKEDSDKYSVLKIDWKEFEIIDNKKQIQDVDIEYKEISSNELKDIGISPFKQGVLLEIIKLRNSWVSPESDKNGNLLGWKTDKLLDLRKYLEKLINPHQAFEKNDFGVYLNANEFVSENNKYETTKKIIGKINNTIFEKLDFKTTNIECYTDNEGKEIVTSLKDKGQIIFSIRERSDYYPYIKDCKLSLYYLNTYSKIFFTKQTGVRSVNYGSVYLFLNGFRITPFGEEGDDWLKLEQRRTQGYARHISTRDLVGRIEVLDDENVFQIVTSREGLVKNDNYLILTNSRDGFIYKALKRLEKYVVDGLSWDSVPDDDKNKISEIEKKIISGELTEDNLRFKEDDVIKKRRVYQYIHSFISVKPDSLIELYINEDLILDKVREEKINAEREFEQLISDFENKKIDGDTLTRILQKKSAVNKDLEKQLADFSKYKTTDATSKAIAELQHYKDVVGRQAELIEKLYAQLEEERKLNESHKDKVEKLLFDKDQAEKQVTIEKEKRERAEKDKEIETLKVEFYRKQSSDDTDSLIHHVKNNNIQVKARIENIAKIISEPHFDFISARDNILLLLHDALTYSKKSLKATDMILRSDLGTADVQDINLPLFLDGYFKKDSKELPRIHINSSIENFTVIGSKLDLALILDNLVDNARKWEASNLYFKLKLEYNALIINVYNDGLSLDDRFKHCPEDIFKFRQTAHKDGSGFGLYLVSRSLESMNASISLDESINDAGVNFKIVFK